MNDTEDGYSDEDQPCEACGDALGCEALHLTEDGWFCEECLACPHDSPGCTGDRPCVRCRADVAGLYVLDGGRAAE